MKTHPVENSEENIETTPVEPVENSDDEVDQYPQTQAIQELTNDLQRTRADFENFRKQADLQKQQATQATKYVTVKEFLPLIDDFSRAISAYPDQLQPLTKNLHKLLKDLHLQVIDSAPGTMFDPDYHEAVSVAEDGDGTEVVLETLRPGYLYDGAVLRAAMVKVGHQPAT